MKEINMTNQTKPSIVFCHGIWADGSCLNKVIPPQLERRIIMKKIYGVVTLATMLMGAVLLLEGTVRVAAAAPPTGIKNVVLVHGAFADGSGWEAVAKILEKDGYTVSIAQPPRPPTPRISSTRRRPSTPWTGQWSS